MHLYEWDGKVLKDGEVLDGPKGVVHALAFSADGKYLAAGDVRTYSLESRASRARIVEFLLILSPLEKLSCTTSPKRRCAPSLLPFHPNKF